MLRIIVVACMALALTPVAVLCDVSNESAKVSAFKTALNDAETNQIADNWPILVLYRGEAFQKGWTIAAIAPVHGKLDVWSVSLIRSDSGQPPVKRMLSSGTCPAINLALSSIAAVDMPHLYIPGFPYTGEVTGPIILDGPGLGLWSPNGRYFGGIDEDGIAVTLRSSEHSAFGRAATVPLVNIAKCS